MKCFAQITAVVCLLNCFTGSVFAEEQKEQDEYAWQLHGQSATYFNTRKTHGDGGTASDSDGDFYREELSLYLTKQHEDQTRTGIDSRVRLSNNERIDTQEMRVLYLRAYHYGELYNTEIGDIAASYNPYVFSASLKGAKVDYGTKKKKGFQASLIGGVQKATWDSVFKTEENEQPDRWIGGGNLTYIVDAGQQLSFTLAGVRDTVESGDYENVDFDGASSINGGFNADWRFNRYLTTKATVAVMQGVDNLKDNSSAENSHAIKLRFLTKPFPKSLKSNFTYEYVDSDFSPLVGTGSSDRERFENETSYYFNRQLKFRLTLKHSRDNLNGQLDGTQRTNDGNFYIDYRPEAFKRLDLGLRLQAKTTDGRGADLHYNEGEIYVSTVPKSGWKLGGSYIYTDINDDAVDAVDQDIHTFRSNVGWKKRFDNGNFFRSSLTMDYRLTDQATGDFEKIGGKIDVGYDAGDYWSFDLFAQTNFNMRRYEDDTDYNAYQLRATYHPFGDPTKSIRLTAEQRFYGSDSSDPNATYTEDIAELAYLFSF